MKFCSKIIVGCVLILIVSFLLASCAGNDGGGAIEPPGRPEVILATTTSTQDSGLLDELVPKFEEETGYVLKVIAVGTGQALQMGEDGNADVLFVHAPASEKVLIDNGSAVDRQLIMHNDFVIVGPTADPSGISGVSSPVEALGQIAASQNNFASRGDDSGTHKKERAMWESSGLTPEGEWYLETGQGMGATLKIASEKLAYTLTDRATYLVQKENLDLDIMVEGDPSLLNVYHTMIVNPEKFSTVNEDGARSWVAFLIRDDIQEEIGQFGMDRFGQALFFPDADKSDADLGLE